MRKTSEHDSARPTTVAHLSDLHIGSSPAAERSAYALCQSLIEHDVDHVVITGDITHSGRLEELVIFRRIFGPLFLSGRVSVVPGNHDRLGDDLGRNLMIHRVDTIGRPGVHLVRLDTTGAHNRFFLAAHGEICDAVIAEVAAAVERAPPRTVVALLLHHHVLPLPEESLVEHVASRLGWPNAAELELGRRLLDRLRGRCDLVLHGHRHRPAAQLLWDGDARRLAVYNAGSSTGLGRYRVFTCLRGELIGAPRWVALDGREAAATPAEVAP